VEKTLHNNLNNPGTNQSNPNKTPVIQPPTKSTTALQPISKEVIITWHHSNHPKHIINQTKRGNHFDTHCKTFYK